MTQSLILQNLIHFQGVFMSKNVCSSAKGRVPVGDGDGMNIYHKSNNGGGI